MRRRSSLRFAVAALLLFGTLGHTASAQGPRHPSFGVLIGGSLARVVGVNLGSPDVFNGASTMSNRVGGQIGAYVTIPFNPRWSVQPEVSYVQKGAQLNVSGSTSGSYNLALAYVEVPVLLRADLGTLTAWHPLVVAGPSFATRVGCSSTVKSGASTVSVDCDKSGSTDPFKSTDMGVLAGVGMAGSLGGLSSSLQLRYSRGLSTISTTPSPSLSPKNSVITLAVSVGR
jgi:hypothetical protein